MASDDPDLRDVSIGELFKGLTTQSETGATNVPHRMREAITGTIKQTRRAVSRANAVNAIRENPLGLFLGMAAVGFAIGWLLPVTPLENERLAPTVDRMKERAKDQIQRRVAAARDAAVTSITNAMGG